MRTVVVGGLLVALSLPFRATDWTQIIERVDKSVLYVGKGCSAFVINEEKDYALTALHCKSEKMTAGMIPATIIAEDEHKDFLVLHVPALDKPGLVLSDEEVKKGQEVAWVGHGYALERSLLGVGYVSNPAIEIPELAGQWVATSGAFIGGMSGGPVVNVKGEVVAIVQMSSDRMGIGRNAKVIKDRVGKYWAKPADKP